MVRLPCCAVPCCLQELLQSRMQEQFSLQQQAMLEKITDLEAKLGGKPGARPPSTK